MRKKIIIIVMVLILMFVITGCSGESKAISKTEEFLQPQLKSPSSAKFPSNSDYEVTEISDNIYRVIGYVDSQNGFGAMVRTHFVSEVQIIGNITVLKDIEVIE